MGFFIRGIMSNVYSLKEYRDKKVFDEKAYLAKILCMHKIDLLEEMCNFNEQIQETGYTNIMCKKGQILYTEILRTSETPDLRELSKKMLQYLGAK